MERVSLPESRRIVLTVNEPARLMIIAHPYCLPRALVATFPSSWRPADRISYILEIHILGMEFGIKSDIALLQPSIPSNAVVPNSLTITDPLTRLALVE